MSLESAAAAPERSTLQRRVADTRGLLLDMDGVLVLRNEPLPGAAEALTREGAYSTAKEAMRSLTRVAAREWGQHKINVNCICPFASRPAWAARWDQDREQAQQALTAVAMGRVGDCERDIGRAVVFLAGPDSDFITGATIMVDGGETMLH